MNEKEKGRKGVEQPSKRKVYQDILEELRAYIRENRLTPGDKLPSERELSLSLEVGRSSIREALRALELLGLIVTKRGEGTFLRTYRSFQTVELLSSFILLEDGTRNEVLQVKKLIEKEAMKLALPEMDNVALSELRTYVEEENAIEKHMKFFTYLLRKANNELLLKIWTLLEEFTQSIHVNTYAPTFYNELLKSISAKDIPSIESLYE